MLLVAFVMHPPPAHAAAAQANGVAPGKNGGEKAKDAHALPSWLQDTALKTAASNVATQSWPVMPFTPLNKTRSKHVGRLQ